MRCSTGTKSGPPCAVTRETNAMIEVFVAPSFQDGSGSVCACTCWALQSGRANRIGSTAAIAITTRRVTLYKGHVDVMLFAPGCVIPREGEGLKLAYRSRSG